LPGKKRSQEPVVRVAPLGELNAYTISEHELDQLAQGSPSSDLLTIGLCLLSAALTVLATLLSTGLPSLQLVLFFCSLLILAISGGICTFLGWQGRKSTKKLVDDIRGRMPAAPLIQQVLPESPQPVQPPSIQSESPRVEPPASSSDPADPTL
jgi:hypothetical protein